MKSLCLLLIKLLLVKALVLIPPLALSFDTLCLFRDVGKPLASPLNEGLGIAEGKEDEHVDYLVLYYLRCQRAVRRYSELLVILALKEAALALLILCKYLINLVKGQRCHMPDAFLCPHEELEYVVLDCEELMWVLHCHLAHHSKWLSYSKTNAALW